MPLDSENARSGATVGWTWDALRAMSLDELEGLWTEPVERIEPQGVFRGGVLARIEHATAQRPLWRWTERIGFEWTPFGIDFDRRLWFFFEPRLATGRFEPRWQGSRWRDTDAIALRYHVSKLPRAIRRRLYDEVKPLSQDWILGIGGIDAERGEGDHFFFALERMRPGASRTPA